MKKTNQSPVGTSYHNCTITATVNELKAILGEPVHSENDGEDKVNFEWNMETNEGDVFTVYDWKEYRKISEDEKINWHIGGKSGGITIQAQAELATALTTPVKDAGQSDNQTEVDFEYFPGNEAGAFDYMDKQPESFHLTEEKHPFPLPKDNQEQTETGGFTPGKWDIVESKETHHTRYEIKSNGWHIATLNPYSPENTHAKANAELIVKAVNNFPAMYEALKELLSTTQSYLMADFSNMGELHPCKVAQQKAKAILTSINKD